MIRNMRRGVASLFKQGTSHLTGVNATIVGNIEACRKLADLTKTSFGPNGMNKMVINHLERLYITSDTATILAQLEVSHPATKLVTLASHMQEKEIGDGSNLVVILIGALLKEAAELIRMGVHPNEIVTGYEKAAELAIKKLDELSVFETDEKTIRDKEVIQKAIKTSVATKQYGKENFISKLISECALRVLPKEAKAFNVDRIRICKLLGGALEESMAVNGVVVMAQPRGVVKNAKDAKIVMYSCSLDETDTETKSKRMFTTVAQMKNYNNTEEEWMEDIIKGLKKQGVNVIVTNGAFSDLAVHYLDKYGILGLKIHSKFQLRRLATSVRAKPQVTFGDEIVAEAIGFCKQVEIREVGLRKITVFEQDTKDDSYVTTVLLRGSTANLLNICERAVDDGVNIVKALGKDSRFVTGGGATELELAKHLKEIAETGEGLEQYTVKAFGDAFLAIPRQLIENAGEKPIELLANVVSAHTDEKSANIGINIETGKQQDCFKANILDLLVAKKMAIKLATDMCITLLKCDSVIKRKQAGGPKMRKNQKHWDSSDDGMDMGH